MYNQGDPGHGNREKWYYPLMDGGPPMHGCPLIVTAGVVREGDAVLIARRTSGTLAGQWEFPGGKLEPGESPETCLTRELREELGLEAQVEDIFAVVYHEYPEQPVLLLAYACRLADRPRTGTPPPGQFPDGPRGRTGAWGSVGAQARWVQIADLERYAFAPADLPIVEKLQRAAPRAARQEGPGYRWPDVPAAVRNQVVRFVDAVTSILTEDLLGIYLHGSLAMGGFDPERSDIDLLVLVRQGMAVETKRRIGEFLLGLSGAPCPIEVSFLREADLIPWRHPTPYDLHFSEHWRQRYTEELRSGAWVHWNDTTRDDADLAAHLTVTRHRGVCLAGKPMREVLPPVPWRDYLESITGDLTWAVGRAERDTAYLVLNACRVLAAAREGLILTKREAALWAMDELPETLRPVVKHALRRYRGEAGDEVGPTDAEQLIRHVLTAVRQH